MKNLPCADYSDVELGIGLVNHGQLGDGEICSGSDLAPGVAPPVVPRTRRLFIGR